MQLLITLAGSLLLNFNVRGKVLAMNRLLFAMAIIIQER